MASSNVTLKLAHPLTARYAVELGLADEDLPVGAEITVHPSYALRVIAAGYAQVDPENTAAVAATLNPAPAPSLTAVQVPVEKPEPKDAKAS